MAKTTEPKKKSFIGSVFGFIFKIFAVICAVCATYAIIKKKLGERREQGNFNRIVKEYFNYFGNRVIKTDAGKFEGMLLKSMCAATAIDMSESYCADEAFISIESVASAVSIIVPKGTKVSIDGLIKGSAVDSQAHTPCGDDSPVLYVALRATASAVKVVEKE